MRLVNILLVFVLAPFIGMGIAFADFGRKAQDMALPLDGAAALAASVERAVPALKNDVAALGFAVAEQERYYREQENLISLLAGKSRDHKQLSDDIYEQRILAMLGPPIGAHISERVEIKVFRLDELGYRGYIAKLKLFDPSVFRVVLAGDRPGVKETTGEAAARTGAVLGINGGGFYSTVEGGMPVAYPIGNTVTDGRFIRGFNPSDDAFFAGINKNGKLIGGIFPSYEPLKKLEPWQGVSFLPVLIKDGRPLPISRQWQATRQPRTIIGEYANGDIILIVVDGRQADWSAGVTLERLQVKLAELGVKEGYNLDGGGSSTFVFKGVVLNRPSDGRLRPVVTNIVILP